LDLSWPINDICFAYFLIYLGRSSLKLSFVLFFSGTRHSLYLHQLYGHPPSSPYYLDRHASQEDPSGSGETDLTNFQKPTYNPLLIGKIAQVSGSSLGIFGSI
jgi:hypothetical protein